jgi:hypothetical protein
VCIKAAQGGSIEVMHYLLNEAALATPEILQEMLNAAGAWEHLEAAQWLKQQGAEWPDVLQHGVREWTGARLVWARQQGCTAPAEEPEDDE